ncbi:hypothetical protein PP2015_3493 [Pseudoalteromonas phenolica]|uniref:Uncharacterized protein n=2 Tax=Pseudoalteromonas phenolica TaxID=161398 RepID=A0A0S2K7L0_9GAMM|nr:hypothetical protein PP2015_3493 [Pseudoalteromonas phenolica]
MVQTSERSSRCLRKVKRASLTTLKTDTLSKQGYFCARATSDRNEVSQHEEVRVWIPDGRSYMDVKQHSIQNLSFIVRAARLALSVRPWMAEPDPSYMEVLQLNSYQNRNEVSQREEVKVWIPDGRRYMDVKQHSIQNFSFIVRAARLALSVRPNRAKYTLRSKVSFAQGELGSFKKCQDIFRLHGCKTTPSLIPQN